MSPWTEFTQENVNRIPEGLLGVYQLAKNNSEIAYVGRADADLRRSLTEKLNQGYTQFQWVQVPWVKETYEMQCRLYHHAGGRHQLDNVDHPYPPEGKLWRCAISTETASNCEV